MGNWGVHQGKTLPVTLSRGVWGAWEWKDEIIAAVGCSTYIFPSWNCCSSWDSLSWWGAVSTGFLFCPDLCPDIWPEAEQGYLQSRESRGTTRVLYKYMCAICKTIIASDMWWKESLQKESLFPPLKDNIIHFVEFKEFFWSWFSFSYEHMDILIF